MKTICIFNHKGGVGKTSITYNLGWILALKGYKTLLFDLDPQCNLTALSLKNSINENNLDEFYQNNLTMKIISQYLINGDNVNKILSNNTVKLYSLLKDKLLLLPGHLNVSNLDPQLIIALKTANTMPLMINVVSNFFTLMQTLSKQYDIDYILIDLGPHIGGISELTVMSSDCLIVPTSPDYFCLQSIYSLTKNISRWFYEIEQFNTTVKLKDTNSFQIKNYLKTLGLVQQYKGLSSDIWNKRIEETFNNVLVSQLSNIGYAPNQYSKTCLPYFKAFHELIYSLNDDYSKIYFAYDKDSKDNMAKYIQELSLFANKIL